MTQDVLLWNFGLAFQAWVGSAVYLVSTIMAGRLLLRSLRVDAGPWALPLQAVAGMGLYSLTIAVFAFLGVAYAWLIGIAIAAPLLLGVSLLPGLARDLAGIRQHLWPRSWKGRGIALLTFPAVIYVGLICIVNPLGGDLCNYHLIVPRDILASGRFVFNEFTHEAGIPYGWHLYGVPAFLLGGDRGYIFMSFWAFCLLLLTIFQIFRNSDEDSSGHLAVFVAALAIAGLGRTYVANNDIPSVLVEVIVGVLALAPAFCGARARSLLFGLAAGFAIAIKLTLLPGVLLFSGIYVWRLGFRAERILPGILVGAPLASLWPIVSFIYTGSPLPRFQMALRAYGPPLPQLLESIGILNDGFAAWYPMNFARFFTAGMETYLILLGFLVVGMALHRVCRTDPLLRVLVLFALGRWALMVALTGRMDVFWHDRYHLISHLALALAGFRSAWLLFRPLRIEAPIGGWVLGASLLLAVVWQFTGRFEMRSPNMSTAEGFTFYLASSPWGDLRTAGETFKLPPGAGPNGGLYDWMAANLGSEVLVATTVVDPYHIQRPTLQLLPVSQEAIDLAASPESILRDLRGRGVTHLHLTQYSGLNGWMNSEIDRWLRSVRAIPELDGVELVISSSFTSDKGDHALYSLLPAVTSGAASESDSGVTAVRRPGEQIDLRWQPDGCTRELAVQHRGKVEFLPLGKTGVGTSHFLVQSAPRRAYRFRIQPICAGQRKEPDLILVQRRHPR
ncbi:MAG: hypothetical protein GY725_00085 [bacterium]|nr:hypothetical protein [bacterium]